MSGGLSPPEMVNSVKRGGVIIRHREYLGDITGNTLFTRSDFPINPGLFRSFPWLSQVAGAFEQYKWRGLIFEFKSTCSDAIVAGTTTPNVGTIIMATDYNPVDGESQFVDKMSMENAEYSNSSKPSCDFIHPVECAKNQTPFTELWVRDGTIGPSDQRLYDIGVFSIASQGFITDNSPSIGELWATFEIEFFKTKFNYGEAEALGIDVFEMSTAISNTAPWGNAVIPNPRNTIDGFIDNGGTLYRFPNTVQLGEQYQMIYQVTGGTASGTINQRISCTVTVGAGLTKVKNWAGVSGGTRDIDDFATSTEGNGAGVGVYKDWLLVGNVQVTDVKQPLTWGFVVSVALPTGAGLKGKFMVLRLPVSYEATF